MQFGILAAGEGSRLAHEGVVTPKPLVKINGQPMILRLMGQMVECGASSISVIVSEEMTAVGDCVRNFSQSLAVPVNVLVKSTPSSLHSFYELGAIIKPEKFIVTTVDTIFNTIDMKKYADAFETIDADAYMAVTSHIDDEKPLYVEVDDSMNITGFLDSAPEKPKYVSGGIYGMGHKALSVARRCVESGCSRMRNFQRQLLSAGLKVKACDFGMILDVDHATDIEKANIFLS